MNFKPTEYELVSVATGERRPDTGGWTLEFPGEPPGLIRTDYVKKQIELHEDHEGIYRFSDWLPVKRLLKDPSSPVTYKSSGIAADLGLDNLWIIFNGWWPEIGAKMRTGTFKECEAYSVCARMDDNFDKVLVVASAGNTARAFARVCSDNNIPLLLFVPEQNLSSIWFESPIGSSVKLVAVGNGGDYFDSIRLSNSAVNASGFLAEGGAKNVARRDGMATTVISAATTIGRIPDAYFQAVGSGTGAIAAWEASLRFLEDGRFGSNKMRLMVSQNEPFIPMADSWKADSREFILDDDKAREEVNEILAHVLSNRRPPWGLAGGLYDALKSAGGDVLTVNNNQVLEAAQKFKDLEGSDISMAAAVAVASLYDAVKDGKVKKDEVIALNITGGGQERLKNESEIYKLQPSAVLDKNAPEEEVIKICSGLF